MYGAYLPKKPKRVLVLGSGALQIGQAGEFDYSGSQAIKALREEGIYTVLVNPNIATIQTSEGLADEVYLVAVTPEFVEKIIIKEEVDAIMLAFGGQTALNCGVQLHERGILEKYGVRVLGTPVEAIIETEDRQRFADLCRGIDVKTARSIACDNAADAKAAAKKIGFPIMLRGAFALGGKGSGIVETEADFDEAIARAYKGGINQVLVEECLRGWKEIEYEVVRDGRGNCITVCNMENFDPLGIHTGESIVVAPSQTLNDEEYQLLRSIAQKTVHAIGVVGECNIQYAFSPDGTDYRVIEVNARLSRSSALASKATGYPLAYVAAKIGLGYALPEIANEVTRRTTAFFEPAMDYLVCKIPRWDLTKFDGAVTRIGSEMKSVGEVMAIGRTFPEVIQKALRMLDIGVGGLDPNAFEQSADEDLDTIKNATVTRVFAIARAMLRGKSVDDIHDLSKIDKWFLHGMRDVMDMHQRLGSGAVDAVTLRRAKELGFSDRQVEKRQNLDEGSVREKRAEWDIRPHLCQIDTLAAEYPAETNYLYSTYHAKKSDVQPSWRKKIMVLGSGTYRIGSSVEFDWCCVNAAQAAQKLGYETIMVNYNPETVSTDYDVCDKLVFDEVSLESILDLYEIERPDAVVVSMGGQVPNNIARRLAERGVKILGTSARSIDRCEDRGQFSALLDKLGIDQPKWGVITDPTEADAVCEKVGGFPVLVRPSYVLSGAAMRVAHERNELLRILKAAKDVSPDYPVVVSKFETRAREVEIDAVADNGKLVLWAISEHIEDAGVHSGDATLVLPPQTLTLPTIRRVKQIAQALAEELDITGPFNMQCLAKRGAVKVIECNLRASRSLPFSSKVTGKNFVAEAMKRMLGVSEPVQNHTLDLDYVGVKAPMFSFARLQGADPVLGVEMASTGEVGCFGDDLNEALLHAMLATGFTFPKKAVLLSLGPQLQKFGFAEQARILSEELGIELYATRGTANALNSIGIKATAVGKDPGDEAPAMKLIDEGKVDLVINVVREFDEEGRPDGYLIRRRAVDAGLPLLTDLQLAKKVVEAMWAHKKRGADLGILPWSAYKSRRPVDFF